MPDSVSWPYLQTIVRLLLALGLGLFIGLERERRGKEAGLRTFGFAALIGGLGGLLGEPFAILSIVLIGVLAVLLNVHLLRIHEGTELTTSAALLVTGFAGVLCGQGHTLTPTAVAVVTAALLAWKRPMSGFTLGLSEEELRSAILLAILAFVIFPALPKGSIDPWGAIYPRTAWLTVILIAGMGFVNYVLLKLYGRRGFQIAGFLGGLVNSTVAVSELAGRVRETKGALLETAYRGILLATAAMLLRNAVLLAILAPRVLLSTALPLLVMLAACAAFAFARSDSGETPDHDRPVTRLEFPFSLRSALQFGLVFLGLQIAGAAAQRGFGQVGVYAVGFLGGLFSSSSAVASAATLASAGTIPVQVAGTSALVATCASVLVSLPLIVRSHEHRLLRRLAWVLGAIVFFGAAVAALQTLFPVLRVS